MAKYYFHLDSTVPYFDQDGIELSNDTVAWAEAKRFTRDIELTLQPRQEWRLEVRRGDQPL